MFRGLFEVIRRFEQRSLGEWQTEKFDSERQAVARNPLSATTAKLMVFKLVTAAAKTRRRLKGENQLPKVVQGVRFQNGIEVIEMPAHHAA
jgi:hypothetical protein